MKTFKLILFTAITLGLLYIPYLGEFLRAFNTMIHESGHAFMTLLTSGKVDSIALFANTEGVTKSYTSSWFGSVLISLSGYLFSSFTMFLMALMWKKERYKTIALLLGVLSLVNLVLWVRNLYGLIWVSIFTIGIFYLIKSKNKEIIAYVTLGLLVILLTDAFRASFDILQLSYKLPLEAGDATNLSKLTFIPALGWGLFFFIQNGILLFFSIKNILKKK